MSAQPHQPHDGELELLLALMGNLRLRNCPLQPTAIQEAFLLLPDKEVFFGGAAGGGKTIAMLMAALQYTDVPGYRALLLRPSQTEFGLAGSLMELATDWLTPTKARWNSDTNTWRFPGPGRTGADGASLTFAFLNNDLDVGRYAGTSYSFIGFDELTRFKEIHYRRMFRALRQATGHHLAAKDGTTLADVPPRIRSTSNPGGPGHAWVKDRFVDPDSRHPGVVYLASRMQDNPHLDLETYKETLGEMPTAELHRLLHGNWDIPDDGELFQRDWFPIIEAHQLPTKDTITVRAWDLAATEPSSRNRDPDWTVGVLMMLHRPSKTYTIADITRERKAPGAIQTLILETAKRDGANVRVALEEEPGSSGKFLTIQLKKLLAGHTVHVYPAVGSKLERAWPIAGAAENGQVQLVRNRHMNAVLDELVSFPHGSHDDTIDALSLAHAHLTKNNHGPIRVTVPRGYIDMDPNRMARILSRGSMIGEDPVEHISRITGIPIYNSGGWRR